MPPRSWGNRNPTADQPTDTAPDGAAGGESVDTELVDAKLADEGHAGEQPDEGHELGKGEPESEAEGESDLGSRGELRSAAADTAD